MTVKRIMNMKAQGAPHIAPDATIVELLQTSEFEDEGAVVVSRDGNTVEGLISERDIVRGLRGLDPDLWSRQVQELMTSKVLTCTPDDRVASIIALMVSKHIWHLPVVNGGKLVGLVSSSDLLKLRLEEVLAEADSMRSYISGRV